MSPSKSSYSIGPIIVAMEHRGLKISRKKTVYLRRNGDVKLDGNSDINLQGENLERENMGDWGLVGTLFTFSQISPKILMIEISN